MKVFWKLANVIEGCKRGVKREAEEATKAALAGDFAVADAALDAAQTSLNRLRANIRKAERDSKGDGDG